MNNSRTLEALAQRRTLVGSLGALDFLIDLELRRQGLNPEKIAVKHEQNLTFNTSAKTKPAMQKARERKEAKNDELNDILKKIRVIRTKLLSLGFTERPLAELSEIADNSSQPEARAMAARELALWQMREKSKAGYRTALELIARARCDAPDFDFCAKLNTVELLCHHFLKQPDKGHAVYDRAARLNEINPDVMLAWVNYQPTPEDRIHWINQVLAHYKISPVALLPDEDKTLYDRLTSAVKLPKVTDGPKVTVLIAAYDAGDVLHTALRSLQEQTWQNLEIIVLDDCSPTLDTVNVAESFASNDPRIRVIRMEKNGGAYVARNRGLDEATGDFITIHDADDWSHPKKIEKQVKYLLSKADVMGCTTEQARATSDLGFTRWTGMGKFINSNISSFMFRHSLMREHFGYWDTVRLAADNELIRRFRAKFGKNSIVHMRSGPYSFQRDSENSMVGDEVLGMNGFYFGARKNYFDAYSEHHKNIDDLKYSGKCLSRLFEVPKIVLPRNDRKESSYYDVIIVSEFRMNGGSVESCIQEIRAAKAGGLRVGVVEMYRYDLGDKTRSSMLPQVRQEIDGKYVSIIAYGEYATCDVLVLRYPPVLQELQRYIPTIDAKEIKVIINQPPMSDYGLDGVMRYELDKCAKNIYHYFGKDATWYPIGPLVREALNTHHATQLHHINLSDEDWHNIIDINEWDRGGRIRKLKGKLRIGRHSRDHEHKWPASRTDILAVYPDADNVEVHVLGGASTPEKILGKIPRNWLVHPFGSLHPRDFLREIDVWIYFANPDWVESFGRTVIEAMATGVPVILPELYRPLFKDAALYATPQTALEKAKRLHANPSAYNAQVKKARQYVAEQFSYEMHIDRLKKA